MYNGIGVLSIVSPRGVERLLDQELATILQMQICDPARYDVPGKKGKEPEERLTSMAMLHRGGWRL
jgi:hypothetical protein